MDSATRLFLIGCAILFLACSDMPVKDKITNFRIFQYDLANGYFVTNVAYEYSRLETESHISLKYRNPVDSFGITLRPTTGPAQCVLLTNDKETTYAQEDMKVVDYNGAQYNIFKFTSNVGTLDGQTTIFVEPNIGLLIYRNDSWIYNKELTSYLGNPELEGLGSLLKEDAKFYLNGNPFNVPEPPQEVGGF